MKKISARHDRPQKKNIVPIMLNAAIPPGSLKDKWPYLASRLPQLPPEKKEKSNIIVIGGGLAACAASAALAEQGYNVKMITKVESPIHENTSYMRGGLNASRNYANDGDSDERFFRDTIEYGSRRSREADVYRMAQLSGRVLDTCSALCVPFLRDEGGMLLPRTYPGGNTARSFQARGQTGRQLLQAFHAALLRQKKRGKASIISRRETVEIAIEQGHARGVITRNLINGNEEAWPADAVVMACGGYSDIYNSKPNPLSGGIIPLWAAYRAGAGFANPCFSLDLPGNATKWKIVPEDYNAAHRCSGGLWVDYQLRTTITGLFAIGEANFSTHGANCMPGNAPLQEISDGLFILPAVIGAYLSKTKPPEIRETDAAFTKAMSKAKNRKQKLLAIHGRTSPEEFHHRFSAIMRDKAGFIRYSYRLQQAIKEIRGLRSEFYRDLLLPETTYYNITYETAEKIAVCLEFGELLIKDALLRNETCGAHFRMDYAPDNASSSKSEGTLVRVWFRQAAGEDIPIKEMLKFTYSKKADEHHKKKHKTETKHG